MYSVVYVSNVASHFTESDLEPLAGQAAAINAKNNLTGMLVYNGRNFMQLLEGNQRRVEQTLDRIAKDPRHSDIVIIRREEQQARECPDWSMRSFTTPLSGVGATDVVFQSLPQGFRSDTRVVFKSFASLLPEVA